MTTSTLARPVSKLDQLRDRLIADGWAADSRPVLTSDDELGYARERADYED